MKKTLKEVSEIPPMDDEDLERFWEANDPESFQDGLRVSSSLLARPNG